MNHLEHILLVVLTIRLSLNGRLSKYTLLVVLSSRLNIHHGSLEYTLLVVLNFRLSLDDRLFKAQFTVIH